MGGGAPKPQTFKAPAATPAADKGPSAADIAAQQEEEKRKRLVALNASGGAGQLTPAGGVAGQANTTRKMLLGL